MRPSRSSTIRPKRAARSASCSDHDAIPYLVEDADQLQHSRRGVGVEVAGRLVTKQQLRTLRKCAGDCDTLRFAAGELRWQAVGLVPQPDEREELERARAHATPHARGVCRERNVLERREVGKDARAPKIRDPATANACPLRGIQGRQRLTVPDDDPAGRLDKSAERKEWSSRSPRGPRATLSPRPSSTLDLVECDDPRFSAHGSR
jgi:hypothetical protein